MSNLKSELLNGTTLRLYDNTRISDFKRCPRYFYFRHVRDWVPDRKSMPLIFGSCWHEAMDTIWANHATAFSNQKVVVRQAYDAFVAKWLAEGMTHPDELSPDEIDEMTPRTPQIALEMLYAYVEAREHIFTNPSFKLIDIERPFAVPLDPNDPALFYVGRLDKVFQFQRAVRIGEHKTSSSYKKDGGFRSDFLDSFTPNSQIDGYLYAQRLIYGETAASVWVDAALVHKSVHDAFTFIPIERQTSMIDSWLWTVHFWIDQIENNKAALDSPEHVEGEYMAAFPQNTGSCGNYGGCPYADICRTIANPHKESGPPLGYREEHWSPFDEIKLEKLGFTVEKSGERLRETRDA